MKFTSMLRGVATLATALALSVVGVAAFAPPASAHTPGVTTTCEGLTVNLTNYQQQVAAHGETFKTVPGAHHDEVVTYQRWSYTPSTAVMGTPLTSPGDWEKDSKTKPGDDPVGVTFQKGNGHNASWFYWEKTVKAAYDDPSTQVSNNDAVAAKTNHVDVTVNGVVVKDVDFGTSFSGTYPFVAGQSNTYKVRVRAYDDPDGSKGWSKNFTGTVEGCAIPIKPGVTLSYSVSCGSITLTTDNNPAVPATWYYGLQGKVDGVRVVSAVQKGPGTNTGTKTFAEDSNGGSVTVDVSVYAATEQDLLPAEWPNLTTVKQVSVSTDCKPNPDAVKMNLTYMTGCAPDTTNTWRIRNESDKPVPFDLYYAGQSVAVASGIAPVGDTLIDLPRTDATAILKWGGGDSGFIAGQVTKASGKDEVSQKCSPQPADVTTYGDWTGAPTCNNPSVLQTRDVFTATAAWVEGEWKYGTPVLTGTETATEPVVLTDDQFFTQCAPKMPTKVDLVVLGVYGGNAPTCAVPTVNWTRTLTTTAYSYVWNMETRVWDMVAATPVVTTDKVTEAHSLTAEQVKACTPVVTTPKLVSVIPNLGGDVSPWEVGGGISILLAGAGLVIAGLRRKQ